MAGWRRAVELAMTDEEIATLTVLSRSRTELASRVSRAQMLLAYRENPSFCAVGQRLGVHHQTAASSLPTAPATSPTVAIPAIIARSVHRCSVVAIRIIWPPPASPPGVTNVRDLFDLRLAGGRRQANRHSGCGSSGKCGATKGNKPNDCMCKFHRFLLCRCETDGSLEIHR